MAKSLRSAMPRAALIPQCVVELIQSAPQASGGVGESEVDNFFSILERVGCNILFIDCNGIHSRKF